jgi:hypothetical protein
MTVGRLRPQKEVIMVDLRFQRVNYAYISAYEAIEEMVKYFGVDSVQAALNQIAAQPSVQPTLLESVKNVTCPNCDLTFDVESHKSQSG